MFHLLAIFTFLCAFQLEHARTLSITLGRVAGSTFIVRRTTVESIRGRFTFQGGVPVMCFSCPARPFLGSEWG